MNPAPTLPSKISSPKKMASPALRKKRRLRLLRSIGSSAGATAIETFAFIASLLPRSWKYPFAKFLGRSFGRFAPKMRNATIYNLRHYFNWSENEIESATTATFENFGLTLFDFFFPDGVTLDVAEKNQLEKLRAEHGGIMFLTFHMGHWELGARKMREWGWPVTAVYQPYTNKKFKNMIEKRRAPGVNFVAVGRRAAAGVGAALRRGDVVAMLGDHPFGEDGMPVTLRGRKAIWPRGPVVLAVKEKSPIVVAVIIRVAPRKYRAIVEEAIVPSDGTRAEVDRIVQEVAEKFGKLSAQYPTQWYRFRPLEFVE